LYKSAKLKVLGGKLLEITLEYNGVIKKATITGDFFMYPESALQDIEKSLVGTKVERTEQEIAEQISKKIEGIGVTMIGIGVEDIAKIVKMAVEE